MTDLDDTDVLRPNVLILPSSADVPSGETAKLIFYTASNKLRFKTTSGSQAVTSA